MARPASNLHLQPKNGGWRARVLVPVELQGILGKKLFHTPVWRVTKSEAAVLAYPEVQKFEALIDRARSGGGYYEAVEVEAEGPLDPLDFRQSRGAPRLKPQPPSRSSSRNGQGKSGLTIRRRAREPKRISSGLPSSLDMITEPT